MDVFARRRAGVLLHPTSLPGSLGNGDLGPDAYRFVDMLVDCRISLWQTLPLGPTHDDLSPYQCLSVHAGDFRLISLQLLVEQGWLDDAGLDPSQDPDVQRRLLCDGAQRATGVDLSAGMLAAAREAAARHGLADRTTYLHGDFVQLAEQLPRADIVILDKVRFESARAVIKPESYELLDEVADVIRRNPQAGRVEVQGHTDSQGSDTYNLDLSQRRAEAIVEYLVGQGVAATVDMRTVRPLDYGERAINLNARYEWLEDDLVSSRDNDGNRFSAIYIDQFADDTVGLLVGFAHATIPSSGRNNNAWGYYVGDGEGNVAVGGGRVWVRSSAGSIP